MIDPIGSDINWPAPLPDVADTVVRLTRPGLPTDLQLFAGATYTVLGAFNVPTTQNAVLESIEGVTGSRVRTSTVRTGMQHGAVAGKSWAASKDLTVRFWLPAWISPLVAERQWAPSTDASTRLGLYTASTGWRIWSGRPTGLRLTRNLDGSHSGVGVFTAFDPLAYAPVKRTLTISAPTSGGSGSGSLANQGTTLAPWWVTFAGNPQGQVIFRMRNTEAPATDYHIVRIASRDSKFPLLPMLGVGNNELRVNSITQTSTANVSFHTRDAFA